MALVKTRLDQYLVENNMCENRTQARARIMAGDVYVNGQRQDKAGFFITKPDTAVTLRANKCPYVSRGGLKLEKAIKEFGINLDKKICIDIGASTGGFSDCMLINGAKFIYAVDVGYGQLDFRLRNDERVAVFERTNFRHMNKESLKITDESLRPEFGCADVSFISLKHIFPAASEVMARNAVFVALIKPQFEAGRGLVPRSGIVKDKDIHYNAITDVISYAAQNGFFITGLTYSPIKGGKGNIEYLAMFERLADCSKIKASDEDFILNIVKTAHFCLD